MFPRMRLIDLSVPLEHEAAPPGAGPARTLGAVDEHVAVGVAPVVKVVLPRQGSCAWWASCLGPPTPNQ
jgi:hypothetical protein